MSGVLTSHSEFHRKSTAEVVEQAQAAETKNTSNAPDAHVVLPDGTIGADEAEEEGSFESDNSIPASIYEDELDRAEMEPYHDDGTVQQPIDQY